MDTTKKHHLFNTTLLITGCCIGAGMIGLPVVSAKAGFIPAAISLMVCYIFATCSGLLILESALWFDHKVSFLSIAGHTLGRIGKAITWAFFLFLFYCLFVAYIDGSGNLFSEGLSHLFSVTVSKEIGIIGSVTLISTIVYFGTHTVSHICRIFLIGLGATFLTLLSLSLPQIEGKKLLFTNWSGAIYTLPVMLVCFGYQNLIPTLLNYVKKDVSLLKKAIFIGNLIPLLIYLIWNATILGILPEGNSEEFSVVISNSLMVTDLLEKTTQSSFVLFFANLFSFFAILTPFMTSTIAFVDFLKDGLRFSKKAQKDGFVLILVLLPPTLLSYTYPDLFLRALSIAGGFADVILFGILPVIIVWIGRYHMKVQGSYVAPGGKLFLLFLFMLSISFLLIRN